MDEKKQKLTPETLAQMCAKEIGDSLNKYHCYIDVAMLLQAGQVTPQVKVLPIPEKMN